MKPTPMNIKKTIVVFVMLSVVFIPSIAKAELFEDIINSIMIDIFVNANLKDLIPYDSSKPPFSCLRSIHIRGEAINEDSGDKTIEHDAEDQRGLNPESALFNSTGVSNKIIRCGNTELCESVGHGSVRSRETADATYDADVEWGECRAEAVNGGLEEEGIISNLRHGLDVLRGIFPGRLSSERGIINTIGAVIRWTLGIAGAIFILMIVYGGFQYLIVGSNEKNVDKAKTTLTYAVIGMVIIAGAWLIADFVISMLLRGA